MKRMLLLSTSLFVASALLQVSLAADAPSEVWVDATSGNDETGDGSATSPYQTIQKGVTEVAKGGTVRIAEGVYSTGGDSVWKDTPSRVKIDGRGALKLIGAGRGKTIIRGSRPEGLGSKLSDEAASSSGSPYRCVHIANATGVLLQDLTLECGETRRGLSGGGVCLHNAEATLVDCEIRNCSAGYGAGVAGGSMGITLVRTSIADTYAVTDGGAVTGGTAVVNCVITRTVTDGSAVAGSALYNCTLADNYAATALGNASRAVNSVVVLSSASLDASELSGDSTGENSVFGSSAEGGHYQVAAPILGDFRPLSGSPAANAGLAAALDAVTLPEGVSAFVDFNGNPITADAEGKIAAGAVQEVLTPAAGRVVFTGADHVIGGNVSKNPSKVTWIYPEAYPTQYQVSAIPTSGTVFSRWQRSADGGFTHPSWKDGTAWIMPPPSAGSETVYEAVLPNNVYYVKPDGSDENDGKTRDTAWKTISHAASTVNPAWPAVVYVLPGAYSSQTHGNTFTAGNTVCGESSLFAVNNGKIVFVAEEGPGKTILEGRPCDDADQVDPDNYPGCGSGALNIAVLRSSCALVGFTLRGGRADADGKTGIVSAMSAGSASPQLVECVISNNVSMGYGASISCLRCRVSGNVSKYDTVINMAVQCDVRDNLVRTDGYGAIRNLALFSTAVGTPRSGNLSSTCTSINSVWDGCDTIYGAWTGFGSLFWNYADSETSAEFLAVDPLFLDRETSSVPVAGSPVAYAGVAPTAGNCAEIPWYLYLDADIEGNPIRWKDSKAVIGAYQALRPGVIIEGDECGGYAYEGVSEGVNALHDGLTFAVTPADGTRPCIGVEVNGVMCPFTNHWTEAHGYRITVDASDATDGLLAVKPVYSTDWYADDDGDDSNSGFLPKLAKRTLATAEGFLAYGDTLRVLPGTYDSGSNRVNDTETIWSRIVVGPDHAVVSTDGPEHTFIVGADATVDPDEYGCGTNAIRCATVRNYGTLKGFTLTGGRVNRTFFNKHDGMGGGVIGENSNGSKPSYRARVEDCIISNCTAAVGGAATHVQLARSRVFENTATSYGSAAYQISAYGSYFDRNIGYGVLDHMNHVVSCTVGTGNVTPAGETPNGFQYNSDGSVLINTLFLQPVLLNENNESTVRRCVFSGISDLGKTVLDDTSMVADAAAFRIDADGRPVVGANAGVDCGGLDDFDDEYGFLDPDRDLLGFQRVMNGRMDIGCCEGDWSAVYASGLGSPRHLAFSDVSPDVVQNAGTKAVEMPASATVTLTWTAVPQTSFRRTFSFVVTEGTLSVSVNGGDAVTYTASDEVRTIVFSGDGTEQIVLRTSADGAATLLSCIREVGLKIIVR